MLLHCDSGMEGPTVGLIAAYCYLYGSMGYEESIQLAELALQARVPRVGVITCLKSESVKLWHLFFEAQPAF